MKLIVGLGNPGRKYEKTRHNLGFMIVDKFLKDFETVDKTVWEEKEKFKSYIAQLEWQPLSGRLEKVILAKPKTYMNNSGLSVSLISQYLNIATSDIWVVHDDIDFPLGSMKIRLGGASAGHKGVESIINSLKTDKFWRFRMGIGKDKSKIKAQKSKVRPIDDFVLSSFSEGQKGKTREMIKKGAKSIEDALEEGLKKAMNRFNAK